MVELTVCQFNGELSSHSSLTTTLTLAMYVKSRALNSLNVEVWEKNESSSAGDKDTGETSNNLEL